MLERKDLSKIEWALRLALEHVGPDEPMPDHPHTGSCGPEAGCDCDCMVASYVSHTNELRRQLREALRVLAAHKEG